MKPLIMQFSPLSRHFIPLRTKYFPQHPVLQTPSVYVHLVMSETSFTPIQNGRWNSSFVYFNFYVYRKQRGRQF
jgi:hypothetical protein